MVKIEFTHLFYRKILSQLDEKQEFGCKNRTKLRKKGIFFSKITAFFNKK